jgi:hypothetical protein
MEFVNSIKLKKKKNTDILIKLTRGPKHIQDHIGSRSFWPDSITKLHALK